MRVVTLWLLLWGCSDRKPDLPPEPSFLEVAGTIMEDVDIKFYIERIISPIVEWMMRGNNYDEKFELPRKTMSMLKPSHRVLKRRRPLAMLVKVIQRPLAMLVKVIKRPLAKLKSTWMSGQNASPNCPICSTP